MVVTDQSIVRLPIFDSSISYRPFQNDRSGPFSSHLPVTSTVKMVTLANVMVTQIIHKRLASQAIHLNMAVKATGSQFYYRHFNLSLRQILNISKTKLRALVGLQNDRYSTRW